MNILNLELYVYCNEIVQTVTRKYFVALPCVLRVEGYLDGVFTERVFSLEIVGYLRVWSYSLKNEILVFIVCVLM
jgi:hypothetical protein